MGESKRRRGQKARDPASQGVVLDAPEVRDLLAPGEPINLHLFGLGTVQMMIATLTEREMMAPRQHAFRRAFETIDKIRTGEIRPWQCFLCRRDHAGLNGLSVMAVIERSLGEPRSDKPALTAPVCHACDSVSTEETKRKIQASLHLSSLQEGHA